MRRHRLSNRKSRRIFRSGVTRVNGRNFRPFVMRGGYRI